MRINMIIFTISIEKLSNEWRDATRRKYLHIQNKIEENKNKHMYM
ncbi:hypothetical protein [Halobacillus shinanisalinarum]|nr:hypothetical protein [Halobacillus shinanisalinarum]